MEISVERYHYPIGQGIFSAQIVRSSEKQYVCVYDCGSISKKDVEGWVKDLRHKEGSSEKPIIDLLVISHLHNDHCNAIKYLWEQGFSIKKIVIPYVDLIGKIVITLENSWRIKNMSSWDSWAKHILLPYMVLGTEEDERMSDFFNDIEIVESTDVVDHDYVAIPSNKIYFLKAVSTVWEFLHFSLGFGAETYSTGIFYNDFKANVRNNLGKDVKDIDILDLKDKSKLENLKEAYRQAVKTVNAWFSEKPFDVGDLFNASSIILYSGPAGVLNKKTGSNKSCVEINRESKGRNSQLDRGSMLNYEGFHHKVSASNTKTIGGWLGTGDALLGETKNVEELKAKLSQERINRVWALTVPHHGAWKNSSDEFYGLFSAPRVECIIHSDPDHQGYKHPNVQTREAIARRGFTEVLVSKDPETYYYEKLRFIV